MMKHRFTFSLCLAFFSICTLRADLFQAKYLGDPAIPLSDSLYQYLENLGSEIGLELTPLSTIESEASLATVDLLIVLENGLLQRLNPQQQEVMENWLIGGANRSGGTLLILKYDLAGQTPIWSHPQEWPWLQTLISPSPAGLKDLDLSEARPNQPFMSLFPARTNGVKDEPVLGSMVHQLPHPNPNSALQGGRVFYTQLLHYFPGFWHQTDGNQAQKVLNDHFQEAMMWAVGLSDGTLLEVPLLKLNTEIPVQEVRLDWVTASEVENAYFEIVRSADGGSWEVIETIPAGGTPNKAHYYSYLDRELFPGRYYYRLHQVSQSGERYLSPLAALVVQVPDPLVKIYPNPAQDQMVLEVETQEWLEMRYVIETVGGETIQRSEWHAANQAFQTEIQVAQLPAGLYQLRVQTEKAEQIKQFVKY